jgi:hypothetical protein
MRLLKVPVLGAGPSQWTTASTTSVEDSPRSGGLPVHRVRVERRQKPRILPKMDRWRQTPLLIRDGTVGERDRRLA